MTLKYYLSSSKVWAVILYMLLFFIIIVSSAQGTKIIDFKEQYAYTKNENSTHYILDSNEDSLILEKNFGTYFFHPTRISMILNFTPAKLNSRSVNDGSNWYIVIPSASTETKFLWDNKKPLVYNDTGVILEPSNYWYQKNGQQIRFYYNQTARTFGGISNYVIFEFNTWIVTNATTSGWSTANISLNGSAWTGQGGGGLRINKRNDSQLNMTGLPASWDCDEDSGTQIHNVNNESGLINTTNQGTYVGNATLNYSTGKIGNACSFDGVNDYVDAGNNASLNITGNITIEAWVYPISVTSGNINKRFVSKADTNNGYEIYLTNTGIVTFATRNGGVLSETAASSNPISMSVWSHITVVYNGTNKLIYINGNLSKSTLFSGGIGGSANNIRIGGSSWLTREYNGTLDEVHVLDRARSVSEIAVLFNTSMRTQAMPLILNQTASVGNVINRTRIVYSGQDLINNISLDATQNGTSNWFTIQENMTSNSWYAITNQYQSMDFRVRMIGNGSNTPFLTSLEWDERPNVSSSVSDQSFTDYEYSNVSFSTDMANYCTGLLNGTLIISCTSPHNFSYQRAGVYIYLLNVTNTSGSIWANGSATITISDNFLSQWNSYTNNDTTSFNNSPVNMQVTYRINLNNETGINYTWYKDGINVSGSSKSNVLTFDTLGGHNVSVIASMAVNSTNITWSASWNVGVLDGWATVLDMLNAMESNLESRIDQAGTVGFIGGLIGGAIVIGILKRRRTY